MKRDILVRSVVKDKFKKKKKIKNGKRIHERHIVFKGVNETGV